MRVLALALELAGPLGREKNYLKDLMVMEVHLGCNYSF